MDILKQQLAVDEEKKQDGQGGSDGINFEKLGLSIFFTSLAYRLGDPSKSFTELFKELNNLTTKVP